MKKRQLPNAGLALVGALTTMCLFAGCAAVLSSTPAVSESPTATAPASSTSPEPAQEATQTPGEPTPQEPIADEYSQVIDGILYQGTKLAPVRIGTDVPGSPPEAASREPGRMEIEAFAEAENKYLVYVFYSTFSQSGGYSKVFGTSPHGSFRQLSMSHALESLDEAIAYPPTVDDRVLDRAEYLLFIER